MLRHRFKDLEQECQLLFKVLRHCVLGSGLAPIIDARETALIRECFGFEWIFCEKYIIVNRVIVDR